MSSSNTKINLFDEYIFANKYEDCTVIPTILPPNYLHGDCCPIAVDKNGIINETIEDIAYWYPSPIWGVMKENRDKVLKDRLRVINDLSEFSLSIDRKEIVINKPCIWLPSNFGFYPFGHLHDYLQKMYFLQDVIKKTPDLTFLCSRHNNISNFYDHLSALSGINAETDNVVVLSRQVKYKVKELYCGRSPAGVANYTKESYEWVKKAYHDFFKNSICQDNETNGVKLYLSRNHIHPGKRSVLNEVEVLEYLQAEGFEILYGNEKLREIVNKFSQATVIIGPHGSLFANTIYCNKNCKILEFCPDNRIDKSFYSKLKHANDYTWIESKADGNFNISIDIERVKNFLQSVGNN